MAHFGNLLIFIATICSVSSAIVYFLVWRGNDSLKTLARGFFKITTISIVASLGLLLYLILTHDYSIAYVYSYSSSDLPLGYLISSLWGGQEGTFLLWIFFVSLMGLVMMYTSKGFELGNMFFLNLFMISILLIIIKKSPFEVMPVFKVDGAGLNPLLQNFWMQIHPPIMFVGFAGTIFPFCFAMTALVNRKYTIWAESARRWTMFAWTALGVSLVMGGYWAYKTLGWGGFWAWDPVENSSFIPWIFLTAQVHSLFIQRQRKGLMRFSLFIVCLTFWSVLYGTFLTRSGVLADFSVHSFIDLGINQFLISGLLFFVGISSLMLIIRWSDIKPEPSFSKVSSRSYLVTLGILILFLGGILTLLGTSAPLLTRMTGTPSNVGIPYYFATMTPIAAALLFLLGLFPAFRWNDGVSKPLLLKIGLASSILVALVVAMTGVTSHPLYLMLFAGAGWALVSNSYIVYKSARKGIFESGYSAHIGLAICLIGATVSAGFETKKTLTLPQNEPVNAMGYTLKFVHVENTPKGFDCHLEVKSGDDVFMAVLTHEFPKNSEGVMRKPHVEKFIGHDLYLAPLAMEESNESDPGTFTLEKGASAIIDKYKITFNDFDVDGHSEDGMSMAAAKLTIEYDGQSEDIEPSLRVIDQQVEPVGAQFDYDRGMVYIVGVQPDNGSVILKVMGDFLPPADLATSSLVIELSKKPLINLFWLGAIIVFGSGGSSMRKRYRRKKSARLAEDQSVRKPELVG